MKRTLRVARFRGTIFKTLRAVRIPRLTVESRGRVGPISAIHIVAVAELRARW